MQPSLGAAPPGSKCRRSRARMPSAHQAQGLDEVLTRIGKFPGVNRTTTSILLSTMFERA